MNQRRIAAIFGVCVLIFISTSSAATRYVDVSNAAPSAPYTNWGMAATSIQPAIDEAASGDEILVAPGTYYLSGSAVSIFPEKALTLRSTQSRAAIIDAQGMSPVLMVWGGGSRIEGFTIRNGYNGGSGGGVVIVTNVFVRDCLVVGNRAGSAGGGLMVAPGSTVQACLIVSNAAGSGGGIQIYEAATVEDCTIEHNTGGGVLMDYGTTGLVRNCVIRDNVRTNYHGGGVYIYQGGVVSNCWIANNQASATNGQGGGVYMYHETSTNLGAVVNSVIVGNHAGQNGGGIWCDGPAGTLWPIVNCTIVSNAAGKDGGGVFAHTARLINDIIYFNSAPSNANLNAHDSILSCIISNCCTTSNYFWPNLTNAPAFVDAGAGDFRLATASFCIDAGTTNGAPRTDIDGNPRPRRGMPGLGSTNCDMGAYEYGFHFNEIQMLSSNVAQFKWDIQDLGRYRLDISTNAASNPAAPLWNTAAGYTNTGGMAAGQFAVYTLTVTGAPPIPGNAMFRLCVDRSTLGKQP